MAVAAALWFRFALPNKPTHEEGEEDHRLLDWIACVIDRPHFEFGRGTPQTGDLASASEEGFRW